jgi:hypothetical protein
MATVYASTRYYGPTNYRGSRIRVTLYNQKTFISYDHACRGSAHESAVREALTSWGYMVTDIAYACETETGRGSVYMVTTEG